MAHITKFHIGEVTTTAGTGPFALGGALTAHNTFSSVCAVADTFYGTITAVDSSGFPTGEFVSGLMTYSAASEVTITTIESSSNAGGSVTFSAGTKQVLLVIAPSQLGAGGAEVLTADRTYYVRTDGSDSNDGLTDSAGGAFLTIQKAFDVASLVVTGGHTITVSIADGDYSTVDQSAYAVAFLPLSNTTLIVMGNTTTPANVITDGVEIKGTSAEVHGITALYGIRANRSGAVDAIDCRLRSIAALLNSAASVESCVFVGNANFAVAALYSSSVYIGTFVSIDGSPDYTAFVGAKGVSVVDAAIAVSGTATGPRYLAIENSVIDTAGGGATFLPGDSDGSTESGGLYA